MSSLAQRHPNMLVVGTGLPLLALSFLLTYWFKYGDLAFSGKASWLLTLLVGSWLMVNLLLNLPRRLLNAPLPAGMALLGKATLALLFLVSLLVQILDWSNLSRLLVYGPGVLFAVGLVLVYALYRLLVPATTSGERHHHARSPDSPLSPQLMLLDGLTLVGAYYTVIALYRRNHLFCSECSDILFVLLGFWLVAALVTGKFKRSHFNNYPGAVIPALKALMFVAGGLALALFGLRFQDYSGFYLAVILSLYFAVEILLFSLYVAYRRHNVEPQDLDDVAEISRFLKTRQREIPLPTVREVVKPATEKARLAIEQDYPRDYRFLSQSVDLSRVDSHACTILDTDVLFNLDYLEEGEQQLLVNLHKLNDIRWFNRYFLTAHTRLEAGGYLVGHAQTITTRRHFYAHRYPRPFDTILYALNFLWHRVFPKLPWLKKFYFAVTKGRNRLVSRAEILGRLYFCGFKIVAEQEIGHRFYFAAQKVKEPSYDQNPTYGPLVRLRRIGEGGQPLEVLKFRTMFPYSEYLQDYVYERQQLQQGGKFKDDFRVTGWGRFMRRTWLDELPMLWNWVRGEMQLIGVRPLSAQYLSLYRDEVKELRAQVKPGLLPPFYADMPKTLDDIMASEERYVKNYLEKPLTTQISYFCRCFVNIVFKGKRSQ